MMAAKIPPRTGVLLILLGALGLGLGLWQLWGPDSATGVVLAEPHAQSIPQPHGATPAPAGTLIALPERLVAAQQGLNTVEDRVRARRSGAQALFPDAQAYAQARQKVSLFAEGVSPSARDQSLMVNERRRSDERQWIRYDLQVLAARAEGDQFLFPIDGIAIRAQIDTVELLQGQYRWSGRILGHGGGSFHITQSFGDQYAIGTVQTPAGEFLLEAKNGIGWIAPADKEFVLPADGQDGIFDTNAKTHKH
jgi:hypothetical protein